MMNYKPRIRNPNTHKADKLLFKKYVKPYAPLTKTIKRKYGKGHGRICHRKCRGAKKQYREVLALSYKTCRNIKDLIGCSGKVVSIEKDPNRSAPIALVEFPKGRFEYVIATNSMKEGYVINIDKYVEIKDGNRTLLKNVPESTFIHNIESLPMAGGSYVRSAGGFATVIGKKEDYVVVKLSSGEEKMFRGDCWCSIGVIGRDHYKLLKLYKAGQSFYRGVRPRTRGVAQNPIDHVHGGGAGKTGTKGAQRNKHGRHMKGKKHAELPRRRFSKRLVVTSRRKK